MSNRQTIFPAEDNINDNIITINAPKNIDVANEIITVKNSVEAIN